MRNMIQQQYFCRDSGFGRVVLSLWELEYDNDLGDYVRSPDKEPLIDRAHSGQCTVEVLSVFIHPSSQCVVHLLRILFCLLLKGWWRSMVGRCELLSIASYVDFYS